MLELISEYWEVGIAVGGPGVAFLAWVGRLTLNIGRAQGQAVAELKAMGASLQSIDDKVDTLRVDARDDIEEIRASLAQIVSDVRAERVARSHDVHELYRKLDLQSERFRQLESDGAG